MRDDREGCVKDLTGWDSWELEGSRQTVGSGMLWLSTLRLENPGSTDGGWYWICMGKKLPRRRIGVFLSVHRS